MPAGGACVFGALMCLSGCGNYCAKTYGLIWNFEVQTLMDSVMKNACNIGLLCLVMVTGSPGGACKHDEFIPLDCPRDDARAARGRMHIRHVRMHV